MIEELRVWIIYGLAAGAIVFSVLFLWNFACAPYRIERERREKVEEENARLHKKISGHFLKLERIETAREIEFVDPGTGEKVWSRLK